MYPTPTADQLRRFLGYPADQPVEVADAAQSAEVAHGWLAEATGVDDWPDSTGAPRVVKSWMWELTGIAYENPTSMESDRAGEVQSGWRDRRSQILAQARTWAAANGHSLTRTSPVSRGSFPVAVPWPDPARGFRW